MTAFYSSFIILLPKKLPCSQLFQTPRLFGTLEQTLYRDHDIFYALQSTVKNFPLNHFSSESIL